MQQDTDSDSTESPSHFTDLGEKQNWLTSQSPGQDILVPGETTKRRTKGQSPSTVWDYVKRVVQTYKWYSRDNFVGAVEDDVDAGMDIYMSAWSTDISVRITSIPAWLGF